MGNPYFDDDPGYQRWRREQARRARQPHRIDDDWEVEQPRFPQVRLPQITNEMLIGVLVVLGMFLAFKLLGGW